MTIKILEGETSFEFAVDVPNIPTATCDFTVTSQHSNDVLFTVTANRTNTNDRYTSFTADVPVDTDLKHWNGMHNYRLYRDNTTHDTGSFKLITNPGGTTGTEPYISNNETRQAKVIYRPAY